MPMWYKHESSTQFNHFWECQLYDRHVSQTVISTTISLHWIRQQLTFMFMLHLHFTFMTCALLLLTASVFDVNFIGWCALYFVPQQRSVWTQREQLNSAIPFCSAVFCHTHSPLHSRWHNFPRTVCAPFSIHSYLQMCCIKHYIRWTLFFHCMIVFYDSLLLLWYHSFVAGKAMLFIFHFQFWSFVQNLAMTAIKIISNFIPV